MGMCLGICEVGAADVAALLKYPPLVWKVIAPDDPEPYQEAVRAASAAATGWLERLLGRVRAPSSVPALSQEAFPDTTLDKAWHGIHFLLTGTAWEGDGPLAFLVRGGAEVGDVDVGYGPARVFTAEEVQEIAAALAGIDEAALRARFDPEAMTRLDVYPSVIWKRDRAEDDALGYCIEYFEVLKAFVDEAAGRRSGLLLYVS